MKLHRDWIQELYIKEFIKPKLHPEDFYWDEGIMVMTEHYHLRRGTCCGFMVLGWPTPAELKDWLKR